MSREEKDSVREKRIDMEIVVDAYGPEEKAESWCHYLDDVMTFPFNAECIRINNRSPLSLGEQVEVLSMFLIEDYSNMEMYVEISWNDRQFGVPLWQLKPIGADEETAQAIADWHYWKNRGYEF